jgi:hypothetical protein
MMPHSLCTNSKGSNLAKNAQMPGVSRNKNSLPKHEFRASRVRTGADIDCAASADPPRSGRQQTGRLDKETSETSGLSLTFPLSAPTAPPVYFPTTPHRSMAKTISDQRVKPCWKNRPTLKLWVTIRRVPRCFDLHPVLGFMFCCIFQFQGSNS